MSTDFTVLEKYAKNRKTAVAIQEDVNSFIENTILDSNGDGVKQSDFHRALHNHIDDCWNRGINAGILAPWGHGKTESVAIARVMYEIGLKPGLRCRLLCSNDSIAGDRVSAIKSYIETSSKYNDIFPNVKMDRSRGVLKTKFFVKRLSPAKDATLEASGVLSTGIGSRYDLAVFDDVVDLRNAVLMPALRPQVKEAVKNVWLSRGEPGCRNVLIGTVWHEDDLYMDMINNERWSFLIMSVSEDMTCIECRYTNKGE